jgi:hypothetical protein
MNREYKLSNNPFGEIKFIPKHDGIQPQFIVSRSKNNTKYLCNFHISNNRETKKEFICSGMDYLFDIPIGYYNVTLTGIIQSGEPLIRDFKLQFIAIDTVANQNNGGSSIRTIHDINFDIP